MVASDRRAGQSRSGKDSTQKACQLPPLGIRTTAPHSQCLGLQNFECFDFNAQFGDRTGRSGLVEDLVLNGFDFVIGCFLQVLDIFVVESGAHRNGCCCQLPTMQQPLQLTQSAFKPLAAAAQRLVNGFG